MQTSNNFGCSHLPTCIWAYPPLISGMKTQIRCIFYWKWGNLSFMDLMEDLSREHLPFPGDFWFPVITGSIATRDVPSCRIRSSCLRLRQLIKGGIASPEIHLIGTAGKKSHNTRKWCHDYSKSHTIMIHIPCCFLYITILWFKP